MLTASHQVYSNIQRRPLLPHRTSLPALPPIYNRILHLLVRTPVRIYRTSPRTMSGETRSVSDRMVPKHPQKPTQQQRREWQEEEDEALEPFPGRGL